MLAASDKLSVIGHKHEHIHTSSGYNKQIKRLYHELILAGGCNSGAPPLTLRVPDVRAATADVLLVSYMHVTCSVRRPAEWLGVACSVSGEADGSQG